MPISNGTGRFSVGRDCTLMVAHPQAPGGRLQLDNVMDFSCKQETANIKKDRLDGVQLIAELPKGWTGSFTVERSGPGVDQFFALAETAWFTGGIWNVASVYQFVVEPDGSSTTFQFENAALKFENAGDWKGDASITQHISFTASRRRIV